MNWIYTDLIPERVSVRISVGQQIATINVFALSNEDNQESQYKYLSIELPPTKWGYDEIVNACITTKYPNDKMQAVLNNYLLDSTDLQVKQEFDEMLEWRKLSKEQALLCIEYCELNHLWIH